ncbi:hypothetical protein CLOP_g1585 [Closterium sp. NIES-67]|nr:hypothetical protein CLOP_g1585 [Closterium sp. NIES-67]
MYLDDILIYSKTMDEHIRHLRQVLEISQNEQFHAKLSRSEFALNQVPFLVHVISAREVHVNPENIEAVKQWKQLGTLSPWNPQTLISHRDPKFTSKLWKELMRLLITRLEMSSTYHRQTNGQTERLNQIVEQLLRVACKDEISKWDQQLPLLEFSNNNATHSATGQTPFFLCFGRHPLILQ